MRASVRGTCFRLSQADTFCSNTRQDTYQMELERSSSNKRTTSDEADATHSPTPPSPRKTTTKPIDITAPPTSHMALMRSSSSGMFSNRCHSHAPGGTFHAAVQHVGYFEVPVTPVHPLPEVPVARQPTNRSPPAHSDKTQKISSAIGTELDLEFPRDLVENITAALRPPCVS